MKKLSFIIPTINRYDYLQICLNSLNKTIKPDNLFIHLTIIDDASDDENVKNFIKKYNCNFADKTDKIFKQIRTEGLCETNLKEIWSKHYDENYDLFCNMDPDAIVNPNWLIKLVELHSKVQNIVTPFDTDAHKRKQVFFDYVSKNSIGGICMLFDRVVYKNIVESCLFPSSAWDWEVCKKHKNFYCTTPSYIEHIGKMSSARDSNLIPLFDKAINFIGEL